MIGLGFQSGGPEPFLLLSVPSSRSGGSRDATPLQRECWPPQIRISSGLPSVPSRLGVPGFGLGELEGFELLNMSCAGEGGIILRLRLPVRCSAQLCDVSRIQTRLVGASWT